MKKQLTKIEKLITIYGNTPTDAAKRRIMYLIAEYGNSRELEGRMDENKVWSTSYTSQLNKMNGDTYTTKAMRLSVSLFDDRMAELESQKEKTQ